jgi:hypothetical protein
MALDPLPPALLAQAQVMYLVPRELSSGRPKPCSFPPVLRWGNPYLGSLNAGFPASARRKNSGGLTCRNSVPEALESWHDTKGDHAEPFSRQASAADASGNLYVASSKLNGHGKNDLLLTKYGSGGAVLWSEAFNVEDTSGNAFVGDLKLGPAGEVFVTGTVYNGPANNYDALTLKYSSGGTLLWHRLYNGSASHYDAGAKLYIDASGNAYVAGGTASAGESMNMLCIRYDSGGTLAWARSIDGYGLYDAAAHIYQRSSNTVMVVGAMQQSLSSWAIGGIGLDMALGATSIPLAAFSEAGISEAAAIASDASGNLYVAAYSDGGASGRDIAVAKLDGELGLAWLASYDGPAQGDDEPRAIAVDGAGNVYVAGYATTAAGGRDFLVLKYDSTGAQQWASLYGGAAGQADEARALALGAGGELAAAGYSAEHGGRDYFTALLQPSDGQIYWSAGFNGLANGQDEASRVLIDSTGSIAVSGKTQAAGGGYGYTTVRYAKKSVLPIPSNGPPAAGLAYIENRGQLAGPGGAGAPEVKLYCPAGPPAAYLHDGKLSFLLARIDGDTSTLDTLCRIDASFLHSKNGAKAFGLGKREAYHNYHLAYIPSARERVGLYDGALLADIYDKISLQAGSNSAGPQYSFAIEPGGDPGLIRLRFEGHSALAAPGTGTLEVVSLAGRFELPPPEAFLIDAQGQEESLAWQPRYALQGDSVVYFEDIGSYDIGKHLVIRIGKPPLEGPAAQDDWVTYFGGMQGNQYSYDLCVAEDAFYVVGNTTSIPGFPGAPGNAFNFGLSDIFIAKFNSNDNIEWVAFAGGSKDDFARAAIVLNNDPLEYDLVVGGHTHSEDFLGSLNDFYGGDTDGIIIRIKGLGSGYDYSCQYIGGNGGDYVSSVAESPEAGLFYAAGWTNSTNFFTQQDATTSYCQQTHSGGEDGFIVKLSSEFDLKWATYFGGANRDFITDIVTNKDNGDLFVVGETFTETAASENPANTPCQPPSDGSFPDCIAQGAYHQLWGGGSDAFVAEFDDVGALLWSTYIGGSGDESTPENKSKTSLAFSSKAGEVLIVAGNTTDNSEFPHTPGSDSYFQGVGSGNYVAKFSKRRLVWSSGFGCLLNEPLAHTTVSIDEQGNFFVAGVTNCPPANSSNYCQPPPTGSFPVCNPGNIFFQADENGNPMPGGPFTSEYDSYIALFNTENNLEWSTYFGGFLFDDIYRIKFSDASLYLCGGTASPFNFPIRDPNIGNYQQNQIAGFLDAFIGKLKVDNLVVSERSAHRAMFDNLLVFPNPTQSIAHAHLPEGRWLFKLYALDGRLLQSGRLDSLGQREHCTIELASYPSGIYLAVFSSLDCSVVYSAKIMKN